MTALHSEKFNTQRKLKFWEWEKAQPRWLRSGQAGMAVPQGGREKELGKTTVALERKTRPLKRRVGHPQVWATSGFTGIEEDSSLRCAQGKQEWL
jgi:hypothetical protein